jgi:hypothetical protein
MMHKLNEAPQAQQQKAKKRSTPLSSKKRSNPQTPKTSITDVASAQSTPSLEFQKLQYNFLQQQQHKEQQYRKPNTSASVSVISSTVPKMATSLANQPDNVAPSASTQSAYEKQLLSIISSQLPSSPQKQPPPVGNLPQSMTSNSNVQRLSQLNSMNQNRSNPFQVDPSILPPSTSSVPPYLLETLALQQNFAHSMSSNSTGASMPSILAGLQKSQLNDQQIKTPTHHVKPVGGGSLTAGTSDAAAQLRRYNMGINNNIGGNLNEAQLASLLQRPNNAQQIYAQQQLVFHITALPLNLNIFNTQGLGPCLIDRPTGYSGCQ